MTDGDDTLRRADDAVDAAADRVREAAERADAAGGLRGRLAGGLAEDAAFLRKLKPSLILARARGELPTNGTPGGHPPLAPSGPQLGDRDGAPAGGRSPFLVVAAALAAGILLARLIDWRGHAHPRH